MAITTWAICSRMTQNSSGLGKYGSGEYAGGGGGGGSSQVGSEQIIAFFRMFFFFEKNLSKAKPIGSMYGIFTYIYYKNQPLM